MKEMIVHIVKVRETGEVVYVDIDAWACADWIYCNSEDNGWGPDDVVIDQGTLTYDE